MKSGMADQRNRNEGLLFPRGSTRLVCQTSGSERAVFREATSGIRKRRERVRRMCRGTRETPDKKCQDVRIIKTCKNRKCGLVRKKAICHEMAVIAL